MSRLADLASKLFHPDTTYRPKIIPTEKRIRGLLSGRHLFTTTSALLVWEIPYFPHLWIPRSSLTPHATITPDAAISGIHSSTSKLSLGDATIAALIVPESFNTQLAGYVKIEFKDLDAWFEEQAQIHYHPKDPFHRVDILPSGRHVKVTLAGRTLADTGTEGGVMSLWETNFPGRWYVPATAVDFSLLRPSATKTGCPYKGSASYYDAVVDDKEYKDVVWWYENPTVESIAIRGLLCFYPDKIETFVDGEPIAKIGMPPMSKSDKDSVQQPKQSCNC